MKKVVCGPVLVAFLFLIILGCNSGRRAANKSPSFDKSPATQAKRRQAIDEMIRRRVFTKVEKPGELAYVWVTPTFYALDFDQKKDLMNIVYGYYYEDDSKLVRIFDSMSGKEVGTFSLTLGLELE